MLWNSIKRRDRPAANAALELFKARPEDPAVAARGDRKSAVAVLHKKRPVVKRQRELAGLEHIAVQIGQDRQQDLVTQLGAQ